MVDALTVDVAILGGGPAGCATALRLRQHAPHLSVAVVEASHEQDPIGETLPPPAQELLRGLGVWREFLDQNYVRTFGTLSTWAMLCCPLRMGGIGRTTNCPQRAVGLPCSSSIMAKHPSRLTDTRKMSLPMLRASLRSVTSASMTWSSGSWSPDSWSSGSWSSGSWSSGRRAAT